MEGLKAKAKLLEERTLECQDLRDRLSELETRYNQLLSEFRKETTENEYENGITVSEESELELKMVKVEAELQNTLLQKVKAEVSVKENSDDKCGSYVNSCIFLFIHRKNV